MCICTVCMCALQYYLSLALNNMSRSVVVVVVVSIVISSRGGGSRSGGGSSLSLQKNLTENYETDSKIPKHPHGGW